MKCMKLSWEELGLHTNLRHIFMMDQVLAILFTKKVNLNNLQSVDIVFTADTSKWSRSVVLEAR